MANEQINETLGAVGLKLEQEAALNTRRLQLQIDQAMAEVAAKVEVRTLRCGNILRRLINWWRRHAVRFAL